MRNDGWSLRNPTSRAYEWGEISTKQSRVVFYIKNAKCRGHYIAQLDDGCLPSGLHTCPRRETNNERDVDTLIVNLRAVQHATVLHELLAMVSDKDD